MKKHLLAIAAILLILSLTACTQYVFDWDSLRPQEITDIEDLVLFMQSRETASARLNLTVDPDDSYFPITINGTKKISGSLKIEESRFPIFSSTTTTPPGSNSRIASTDALFVVADDSSLEIENLTATVSSNAVDKVEAIIYVNNGILTIDSFTSPATVTGLAIGPNAKAYKISITDSNIGKIAIDKTNKDTGIYDEIINGNTSDAEITTGFDATTAKEFENALEQFGRVRLTDSFSIIIEEAGDYILPPTKGNQYEIDLNGKELSISATGAFAIEENSTVHFKNGILRADRLDLNDPAASEIALKANSTLIFDNVEYIAADTGVYPRDSNCTITVIDSIVRAGGAYGLGTNASTPVVQGTEMNVENSEVYALSTESVGILFNVPGTLTITGGSYVNGGRQGVILRGGDGIISNSEIVSRGDIDASNDKEYYYDASLWGSGNAVAYAALVIGNASAGTGYNYNTTATVQDSEISMTINSGKNDNACNIFIASANGYSASLDIDNENYANEIISNDRWLGEKCSITVNGTTINLESR